MTPAAQQVISDVIAARKLEAIADEFELNPERWTLGSAARTASGLPCHPHDSDAAAWCQSGARGREGIWAETAEAVEAAARLHAGSIRLEPDVNRAIFVNDKMGRVSTISMLRTAAAIMRGDMRGDKPQESAGLVALRWAIFVASTLVSGAALGYLGRAWGIW